MSDELKYSLEKLRKALNKLKEGSASAVDELDRDGTSFAGMLSEFMALETFFCHRL